LSPCLYCLAFPICLFWHASGHAHLGICISVSYTALKETNWSGVINILDMNWQMQIRGHREANKSTSVSPQSQNRWTVKAVDVWVFWIGFPFCFALNKRKWNVLHSGLNSENTYELKYLISTNFNFEIFLIGILGNS